MNALLQAMWTAVWREAEVSVYATGASSALSREAGWSLLSAAEQERVRRFRFKEDQERWMRSRAILRCCIAARLGVHPAELEFGEGEYGKPFLTGKTAGQGELHFNISHSGDFVAVCLAPEPCGVDIECWKAEYAAEVAEFAFSKAEYASLVRSPSPAQHFLSLWTVKEAVMKCTGQGLAILPSAVWIEDAASGGHGVAGIEGTGKRFNLLRHWVPGQWMLAAALPAREAELVQAGPAQGPEV